MENAKEKVGKKFGVRLKGRREALGLTQSQLAAKVGVSSNTIQNYEGGQFPKGQHLIKLSKALECSSDYLLIGTWLPPKNADGHSVHQDAGLGNVNNGVVIANTGSGRVVQTGGRVAEGKHPPEALTKSTMRAIKLFNTIITSGNPELIQLVLGNLEAVAGLLGQQKGGSQ